MLTSCSLDNGNILKIYMKVKNEGTHPQISVNCDGTIIYTTTFF